jgi:serine/threonine protein kinase
MKMSYNFKLPPGCLIDHNRKFIIEEDEAKRIVNYKGTDYLIEKITSKGANSYILGFVECESSDEEYALVLKICKTSKKWEATDRRVSRFKNEIKALYDCKDKKMYNVVEIMDDGIVTVSSSSGSGFQDFYYYSMEYAENDLCKFIENNPIDLIDKIELCLSITKCFLKLHELGYCHRDIKNDNILFCNKIWKIGDLGLMDHKDEDSIDLINEKIGPYGWLSPEVMNKVLTEGKNLQYKYDCTIDFKSDIYQLGKLFWYIFQNNLPLGDIDRLEDFKINDQDLYVIINKMLQHSKLRRPEIDEIVEALNVLQKKYSLAI